MLAAGALFAMIGWILTAIANSDLGAPGGYTTGLGIVAAGYMIVIGAAVIAAVALLVSSQLQRTRASHWLSQRDGILGAATTVAAVAFLIVALGVIVSTTSGSGTVIDGKQVAAGWLQGAQYVGWAAAFSCSSVGLFLSRRPRT